MRIGIDASRAFLKERTGIEEYSYQVIRHLAETSHCLGFTKVVLYLRKGQCVDFKLPKNWQAKVINWPLFWTQIGLSLEMLRHPVDKLFIPAHTVPFVHPTNTYVTIHGLEYEIIPEAYSFWQRLYMRWSIKLSCRMAKKIIAVSKNTKKDLKYLYGVEENKIEVVYEGITDKLKAQNSKIKTITKSSKLYTKYQILDTKYLLFIGRIEKRKNIEGIIEAYKILKEKYDISYSLVLAGKPGYGYESIKYKVVSSKYKEKIIEMGFISEEDKYNLLKNADVFLFPSLYEGFGLPILEAQMMGTPVVTSNISSMPEVGGDAVAYCDPNEPMSIADSIYKIISDKGFRDGIIKKGYENIGRFSWERCAKEIAKLLR